MLKQEKIEEAILECYCELFNNSEPKLDFKKEFESNTLKDQFYLNHQIDENKHTEIVNNIIKKYKIKFFQKDQFKINIYLGCSPKIKID